MATVSVVFGKKHPNNTYMATHNQTEAITSSGTSQNSSNSAGSGDDCVEVATSGGAVWVSLNGSDASATNGFLLPDGTTRTFDAHKGVVVAVIDA